MSRHILATVFCIIFNPAIVAAQAAPTPTKPATGFKDDCRARKSQLAESYKKLAAENKFSEAARQVRFCANATGDVELLEMAAAGEKAGAIAIARDKNAASDARLAAMELIKSSHPEEFKEFEAHFKKLQSDKIISDKKKAAEEQRRSDAEQMRLAAEKKKHGVSIGMTQADVLASSWGKPQSVNRTISARGTREQWVYGARNYLYFENGVLTTIQN